MKNCKGPCIIINNNCFRGICSYVKFVQSKTVLLECIHLSQ